MSSLFSTRPISVSIFAMITASFAVEFLELTNASVKLFNAVENCVRPEGGGGGPCPELLPCLGGEGEGPRGAEDDEVIRFGDESA